MSAESTKGNGDDGYSREGFQESLLFRGTHV